MNTGFPLWQFVLYFALVIALIGLMIGLSSVLGQRHRAKAMNQPFESGIVSVGSTRFHFPIQFYLIGMFFLIFDLEAVFVFSWAIAFRQVGWAGYIEILVFIGFLIAALIYLWRLGALNWGPRPRGIHRVGGR